MSNEYRQGVQITPVTMAVCGALWFVLAGLGSWILLKIYDSNEKLTTLVTSHSYDRRDIDALRTDVDSVRGQVSDLSQRMGKVEARK